MAKAIINGNEIFGNVHLGEGGDVANPNIADVYDPTQTYNTGDRRIYNDVLYVCNEDNVTGAWDSTKWDSATIDEIISALTADDIPYSSGVSVADKLDNVPTFDTLTSSDNNKLLGVSVSGDDISVGALGGTSETKSCEISLGTGSSLSCFMQTYGKVVVLNLVGYLTSSATITTSDNLFTGLPVINGSNEIYSISQKGRFRLYNGAGEAIIRLYDISATSNYVGNVFVYVTQ